MSFERRFGRPYRVDRRSIWRYNGRHELVGRPLASRAGRRDRRTGADLLVGVDTGGTFTDLIAIAKGELRTGKVLSTPRAPELAVAAALGAALGSRPAPGRLVHGNTVGLNALLTGQGARVALVTNAGFEDLIEIGRQDRPELYALHVGPRPTLVPRELRFGIGERRLADGRLESRASAAELARLRRRIAASGAEAVAVCLLHAYAWPQDEARIARALLPLGLPISLSAELLRRHREFERFNTAVADAFVRPVVGRYLGELAGAAAPLDLFVVRNEGGTLTWRQAARHPVLTILSGPAGGARAVRYWADRLGFPLAVGFDMGGTSADIALCAEATDIDDETVLGSHRIALPAVPITSIGCGGGSIAWQDKGGALRVGPMSAGADPGPACYGKGTQPTVTDAHLVLGRLPDWGLLGGSFPLDAERAARAVGDLARRLHLTPHRAAQGVLAVADLQMARPLRAFTLGRGLDPADLCLVAFGGAGGLHAARLAQAVGFRCVLVPPNPGLLSAQGMLLERPVVEAERALVRELRGTDRELAAAAAELLRATRAGQRGDVAQARVFAAVRYTGSNTELWVEAKADAARRFARAFERRFGFQQAQAIECLRLRARLTLERDRRSLVTRTLDGQRLDRSAGGRPARLGAGGLAWTERAAMPTARWLRGPLAILDYSGTTIVETGWRARRHASGCVELRPLAP